MAILKKIGGRLTWLGVLSLSLMALPAQVGAQVDSGVANCAKRATKALSSYSSDAAELMTDCEVDSLKDDERNNCPVDEDLIKDLDNSADKARREMEKCTEDSLRALCPLDSKTPAAFQTAVRSGAVNQAIATATADIYTTNYGALCPNPRPTGEVENRDAVNCATQFSRVSGDILDELHKCLFKCELSAMRKSGSTPCIDRTTGAPLDEKILDCVDRLTEDAVEDLANRCLADEEEFGEPEHELLVELGCPFGQKTVEGAGAELMDRLYDAAIAMDHSIFRSECKTSPDDPEDPESGVPAAVQMLPSQALKEVRCGDILGPSFFGADTEVKLLESLDCSGFGAGSNGLVIAASGVTIGGSTDINVSGPSKSSSRTGTGILIAPGMSDVIVQNFRAIQNYGIGIGDSGDNARLTIRDLGVRRNKFAGVKVRSRGVDIDTVRADRNVVGFDLGGDGTVLRVSRAIRSEPAPGIGILLDDANDVNGDGRVVRVTETRVDENLVGILAQTGPHLLETNDVRNNLGDAIVLASDGTKAESNGVKLNLGDGIVVSGNNNHVTANRSDENGGYGFLVSGNDNDINNNGAGTLSDHGNTLAGYLISGAQNEVNTNKAEANLQGGFVVDGVTAVFSGNSAIQNTGIGFDVNSAGNNLSTNDGAGNSGFEYSIASGNSGAGNKKNGAAFTFPASGGNFE